MRDLVRIDLMRMTYRRILEEWSQYLMWLWGCGDRCVESGKPGCKVGIEDSCRFCGGEARNTDPWPEIFVGPN